MLRVGILAVLLSLASWLQAGDPIAKSEALEEGDLRWYDALKIGVEGREWNDVEAPYDRLPSKAKATVREAVWNLSRHSAGCAFGSTQTPPHIHARWTVNECQARNAAHAGDWRQRCRSVRS